MTKSRLTAFSMALLVTFVAWMESPSGVAPTEPYRDPGGVWTVCHGETEVPMRVYAQDECDAMLKRRLGYFESVVTGNVTVPLTQFQLIALTSFVYNVGPTNFKQSTLLRKLNAGDFAGACDELSRWVYQKSASPNPLPGLVTRREIERAFCNGTF